MAKTASEWLIAESMRLDKSVEYRDLAQGLVVFVNVRAELSASQRLGLGHFLQSSVDAERRSVNDLLLIATYINSCH